MQYVCFRRKRIVIIWKLISFYDFLVDKIKNKYFIYYSYVIYNSYIIRMRKDGVNMIKLLK